MKLNIGDVITVQTEESIFKVKVEDASKGDIIMAKIETVGSDSNSSYQVGRVYEFDRKAIKDT